MSEEKFMYDLGAFMPSDANGQLAWSETIIQSQVKDAQLLHLTQGDLILGGFKQYRHEPGVIYSPPLEVLFPEKWVYLVLEARKEECLWIPVLDVLTQEKKQINVCWDEAHLGLVKEVIRG